jgi:hypothetical protein
MAIYEVVVPLMFFLTGFPPFWFFALQSLGHLLSALVSNKFYWWYGRKAAPGVSRVLMIVAGCGWSVAGYLFGPSPR